MARKRQKEAEDLNAAYRRFAGRNPPEAGRQEELLRNAREHTAMSLAAAVEQLKLPCDASELDIEAACEKIRDRLVLEALNKYVPGHRYYADFKPGAREFQAALWTEGIRSTGSPSLQDHLIAALQERATTEERNAPNPAMIKTDGPETNPDVAREPAELPRTDLYAKVNGAKPKFQNRAAWLADRLHERGWNKHDVARNNGPDHKTVQKLLNGEHVREDVLAKLIAALSKAPLSKNLPLLNLLDIPRS